MAEFQHGFTTRDEWKAFFDDYFQKINEIDGLVFSLTKEDISFELWIEAYKKRSRIIHDLYIKNDRYLDRHVYFFLNNNDMWCDEVAESLLSYMFRYCTRFQDVEAAYKIAESLFEYYEKKENDIAIMKCYFVLITCYAFLDAVHFRSKILSLCRKGILLYEQNYNELNQEDKSMCLSLYDFESISMCEFFKPIDITREFDDMLLPAFERRMRAIDRYLKEADMKEECNVILPYMRKSWINTFSSIIVKIPKKQLEKDRIDKFYQISYQQYMEEKAVSSPIGNIINKAILMMCEYHQNKISDNEIYEFLIDSLDEAQNNQIYIMEDLEDEIINVLSLFSCILEVICIEKHKKTIIAEELMKRFANVCCLRDGNNYTEHVIDLTIYNYVVQLLPYSANVEEMFLRLLKFTVLRQEQTAIHSIMVSKLASCMVIAMMENIPECIAEAFHSHTDIIKEHKNEIHEYVKHAALLHDVGKIVCTSVINMQYRKLIDIEFQAIQFHPVTSREILRSIPELSCFSDIAEGHHKSYDGTSGYPVGFDNLSSPQKIFIDLISICDAIDAATDTFGRNYTEPKTLETVLQEFIKGKGTRYSPVIVDLLISDKELQDTLKELLTTGRQEAHRFAYDLLCKQNNGG